MQTNKTLSQQPHFKPAFQAWKTDVRHVLPDVDMPVVDVCAIQHNDNDQSVVALRCFGLPSGAYRRRQNLHIQIRPALSHPFHGTVSIVGRQRSSSGLRSDRRQVLATSIPVFQAFCPKSAFCRTLLRAASSAHSSQH